VAVRFPLFSRILKSIIFILLLPYTLLTALCSLPVTLLCNFLNGKFKDSAFHNSVRFIINLVVWPIVMIIYAIIAYAVLPWYAALILTLAILPSPLVVHEAYRLVRILVSETKLWRNKTLREKYAEIRRLMFK
jgi:hypothetical protein